MNIVVIGNKGRWAKGHIKTLKNLGVYGGGVDLEGDWRAYIEQQEPDGIVIATNAVNHFEMVMYCLFNSLPVYCEKPIATEEWQLDKYREYLEDDGVHPPIFQAGFQLLYDPTIETYKEQLSEIPRNHRQDIDTFISRRLGGNYRNESSVQTLMIHDIAIAHYLFGSDYTVGETWGERAETNTNLMFNDYNDRVILHSRYARPSFRQMDFLGKERWEVLEFDNHARPDLLTLAHKSFTDQIQIRNEITNNPDITFRNGLEFAIGVQQNVFDIEKKAGIR